MALVFKDAALQEEDKHTYKGNQCSTSDLQFIHLLYFIFKSRCMDINLDMLLTLLDRSCWYINQEAAYIINIHS